MRNKGIIIWLLAIMTFHGLSLEQLFKLPVLIAHYFEHQERGQSITVTEYLSMHYWGTDINDDDQDRDMQLPFKKVDMGQFAQALFIQSPIDLIADDFPLECSYSILESQHHSSNYLGSLFKPPRLI